MDGQLSELVGKEVSVSVSVLGAADVEAKGVLLRVLELGSVVYFLVGSETSFYPEAVRAIDGNKINLWGYNDGNEDNQPIG